jgi:large subunit ribosomal protein L6
MSRIGRLPIQVPPRVDVEIKGSFIRVKGPKGTLENVLPAEMSITLDNGVIQVTRPSDERVPPFLPGRPRLINNMVVGVSTGFEKSLEINGVGYR